MRPWETLKKETILDHSKFLKVEQHTIELPDGKIIRDWPWVVSLDYVLVLPVTNRNTLFLFYQTKYAVQKTSLAPIGGYLEPGEDALTAAKRELREEMGVKHRNGFLSAVIPIMAIMAVARDISFLRFMVTKSVNLLSTI